MIAQKKALINITIALIFILIITFIALRKYTIAYTVMLDGEKIGFIKEKDKFKEKIDNEILKIEEENVAFIDLKEITYKSIIINKSAINENETFETIEQNAKKIYSVYEVADNNSEDVVYVNTSEEAEELANTLKQEYNEIEPDLKITTLYLEEPVNEESINEAKTKIAQNLESKLEEKKAIDKRTVNGVYLACMPLTGGTITSRYGSRESIRSKPHKGLDISARYGTPIYASADGTVTFAGTNNGGYGKLVIINHGNGVETYYGHCSSILISKGAEVKAGDLIAKVGSTGNSTGNHLHFEIRINGTAVNPQKYIY